MIDYLLLQNSMSITEMIFYIKQFVGKMISDPITVIVYPAIYGANTSVITSNKKSIRKAIITEMIFYIKQFVGKMISDPITVFYFFDPLIYVIHEECVTNEGYSISCNVWRKHNSHNLK